MNLDIPQKPHIAYFPFASLLIIAATLWHYWHTLNFFLLNVPDSDDYIDIFWFLEIFSDAKTLLSKFQALFLPIHEHITVSSHLIYLIDYWIFGKINFAHYIITGQGIVLAICLCIAIAMPSTLSLTIRLAITVVLYLNLAYWHSSFWAMTALSNQLVILFACLAAISFQNSPGKLVFPLAFAVMGSFSQANGLAIFIGLTFSVLCHSSHLPLKKIALNIFFPLTLLLFITLFHVIYQNPFNPDHHLDHQAMITEPNLIHLYQRDVSNTSNLTFSITDAFLSFFIISGATIFEKTQSSFAAGAGFLIYFFWLWILFTKKSIDRFTQLMLVFTLISIGLIAVGRGAWLAEVAAMQSRYRMYSFLLLALSAHQLLKITQCKPAVIGLILFLGIMLQISSRNAWEDMENNYHMLTTSYYNWLIDGGFGRSSMSIYPPNQDRRLFIAYNQGRYNPLDAIPAQHKPVVITPLSTANKACVSPSQEVLGQIQGYSKKPKAKASELTFQINTPAWQREKPTDIVLCGNENSMTLQLDAHNFNAEQNQFWPIIVLKTQVLPGNYSTYMRQENVSGFLGNITIK